jgi:small-conductance mechanosensitive channel
MKSYLNLHLFDLAGTPVTVATLVTFGIILFITFILSKTLERATIRVFEIRRVADEGTVGVASRLVHYLVLLIGTGVALQTVGISMNALFAAGAVFAVGLGFAMQNISQNFVSGVILLIERTIKPGDILQLEAELVRVTRMGIRATVSRTLDDEEIIIPNSVLVQNSVKNYTLQDSLFRLRTLVGVIYDSNMALVRETLEGITREIPWRVQTVQPRSLMKQFGNSSVDFDVSLWIDDPWKKTGSPLRTERTHLVGF